MKIAKIISSRVVITGGLILVVAAIAFVIHINLSIIKSTEEAICKNVADVPRHQTALILGAKVYGDGHLSARLEDRMLVGIQLYKDGKVDKLLLTGDHGRKNYDEVNNMRKYALKCGIPARDIFMDHAGFDTYDSLYRARDIFKTKSLVIVSQGFHLPRALYIANKLGLDAVGVIADKRQYIAGSELRLEIRESLARIKAFMDTSVIHAKPKYLGEVIPITGDGRATVDKAGEKI